jgi:hypothetical protein
MNRDQLTRRHHAVAAFVVAVFVIATCSTVFAYADLAQADACGRAHVWVPASPTAELTLALLDGPVLLARFIEVPRPDETLWLVSRQRDDACIQAPPAEPAASRAPPPA